jgi:hypothetical protein
MRMQPVAMAEEKVGHEQCSRVPEAEMVAQREQCL